MSELVEAIESLEDELRVTNKLLRSQDESITIIMSILICSSSDEIVAAAAKVAKKFSNIDKKKSLNS